MSNFATLLGISDTTSDYINTNTLVANTATISSITDTGLTALTPLFSDATKKIISGTITSLNSNILITTSLANVQVALSDTPTINTLTASAVHTSSLLSTGGLISSGFTPLRPLFVDSNYKTITRDMFSGSLVIGNSGSYTIGNITSYNSNLAVNLGPGTIEMQLNDNPALVSLSLSSATAHSVAIFNSSKLISSVSLADNQVLMGVTGSDPIPGNIYAGTNLTSTALPNSITLGLDPNPSVTSVTSSNLNTSQLVVSNASKKLVSQPLLSGQICIGDSSTSSFSPAYITGDSFITIVNGPSTIQATMTSTPTFSSITDSSLTVSRVLASGASKELISVNLSDNYSLYGTGGAGAYVQKILTAGLNMGLTFGSSTVTLATLANSVFSSLQLTGATANRLCIIDSGNMITNLNLPAGNIVFGGASNNPVIGTLTAGLNTSISSTSSAITISGVASPSFTNCTVSGTSTMSSLTPSSFVMTDGSNNLTSLTTVADGYIPISNSITNNYSIARIIAGTSVSITYGPGTITINAGGTLTYINASFSALTPSQLVATDSSVPPSLFSVSQNDGFLCIGNSLTSSYNVAALTNGGNGNFTITNGHGSITLDVVASPTFVGVNLSGLTASSMLVSDGSKNISSLYMASGAVIFGQGGISYSQGLITGTGNINSTFNGTDYVITTVSSPNFVGVNLSGLTAARILACDGSKNIASLSMASGACIFGQGLSGYSQGAITGTGNINSTFNGTDYVITTISSPTFTSVTCTNLTCTTVTTTTCNVTTCNATSLNISGLTGSRLLYINGSNDLSTITFANNYLLVGSGGPFGQKQLLGSGGITVTFGTDITISGSATPSYTTLTAGQVIDNGLTGSRLVASDAGKQLSSVTMSAGSLLVGVLGGGYANVVPSSITTNLIVGAGSGSLYFDMSTNPTFNGVSLVGLGTPNKLLYLDGSNNVTLASMTASGNLTSSFVAGVYNVTDSANPTYTSVTTETVNSIAYVRVGMSIATIQAYISNSSYDVIEFESGNYTLSGYLVVDRSNLVIRGNNAILTLGNNVNTPLIIIGDTSALPIISVNNITIENLFLDGNYSQQTTDHPSGMAWIDNSCIWMTTASNIICSGIKATNSYVHGFQIIGTSFIECRNCYSYANRSYGMYMNSCSQATVESNYFTNNIGSGIIGADLSQSNINNNFITGNGNYGGFFLTATICNFTSNIIESNTLDGLNFQSNSYQCSVAGNSIYTNGGNGLYVISSTNFSISNNNMSSNAGAGCYVGSTGSHPGADKSSYIDVVGNYVFNNTLLGLSAGTDNTIANGASNCYATGNIVTGSPTNYDGNFEVWTLVLPANTAVGTISTPTTTSTFLTYSGTGLTATLTPNTTKSRVKITVSCVFGKSALANEVFLTIFSNGTNLASDEMISTDGGKIPGNITFIHSPASQTAQVYEVYIRSDIAHNVTFNPNSALASIIAEEIN